MSFLCHFFSSINYFRMLGTGRVNKVFSPRIFISKKMVTNMKLAFANVSFKHNSAYFIKKWLRLKRIVTVRLAYISKSCILVKCLKQRSYIAIKKKIILKLSFLILNTILYFLLLMNTWQFNLSNWQEVVLIWAISVSFVYIGILVEHSRSHPSSILLLEIFPVTWILLSVCLYS